MEDRSPGYGTGRYTSVENRGLVSTFLENMSRHSFLADVGRL